MLFLLVSGSLVTLAASPPVIGVAHSRGAFYVNNASVPGTATIFDGTAVTTATAASDVSLKGGQHLTLASGSAVRIYQDRLLLDRGTAELDHATAYRVRASDLDIAATGGGQIRVALNQSRVLVASVEGIAEVRNSQGMLVARILPGTALQLQSAPDGTSHLTGTLLEVDGKFYLVDETTKVKVELQGPNLKKYARKRIKVAGLWLPGEKPSGDATQVIKVAEVAVAAAAAGAGAGAGAGGAAAGAGAASAGISTATIAVLGGVAAAATVGGLAAVGTIGGSSSSTSVSR